MAKITSADCIKLIKEALREFGKYSYEDKGAHEVMDLPLSELRKLSVEELRTVLEEVLAYKDGNSFVQSVLSQLQGDSFFDELLDSSEKLEDIF